MNDGQARGVAAEDITRLGPRQVFHSAEHVALEVPIAGPTSRILAYAIDSICVSLLLTGLFVAGIFLVGPFAAKVAEWLGPLAVELQNTTDPEAQANRMLWLAAGLALVQFAGEWVYFIVLELVTGGRSIGKALLGLRVCRDGGLPVTPSAVIVRNLLRIVDVLPASYIAGLTSMVVSQEGKRLGDHAAGTVVIRLDRPAAAVPLAVDDDLDFRFERAQLAAMGAEERALLRQTLRRLDALPPEQRPETIARAAGALRRRLSYRELAPDEEERFLRALLRALR